MPIDLAGYSKPIREALRRAEFACVYVASVGEPPLCRVGYAEDLVATIGRLQRASPTSIKVDSALWVPSRAVATNISRAVQCDLISNKTAGGWLNCLADIATRAIEIAAFRIHPGAVMACHDEMLTQWKASAASGITAWLGLLLER
jgi:hypothetical protein